MNVLLTILLIVSILWGIANKYAVKTLGYYFKKKGYPNPTDEELKECSHEVLKNMSKRA